MNLVIARALALVRMFVALDCVFAFVLHQVFAVVCLTIALVIVVVVVMIGAVCVNVTSQLQK